ncbi:MAG: hypothetical protein AAGK02_02675 [Pseudomonadota bacterium]
MKVSRALRNQRREHAQLVVERLKLEVHRIRVNDAKSNHITIWIEEGRRVEWWPSTERWRDWSGKSHFGNALQLVRFIRAATTLSEEFA